MTADEAVTRGFADRKEDLKGKPEPKQEPGKSADNQSGARLAAARLHLAQMRQAAVSAQSASHLQK